MIELLWQVKFLVAKDQAYLNRFSKSYLKTNGIQDGDL